MNSIDPHSVLGLAPGASAREIKHAFRRLAMRWHPDRNTDPAAVEHFKLLRAAHDLLLGGAEPASAPDAAAAAEPPAPPQGADRTETLTLTIEEAYCGGPKTIALEEAVDCDECGGSGERQLRHTRLCAACHGSGRLRSKGGLVACRQCHGRGYVNRETCDACHGDGRRRGSRPLRIDVPPGLLGGDELRIAGAGWASENAGGAPGDLVLRVVLAPHALYHLDGRDLTLTRPVSAFRLLLGGTLPIPLPDGVRHLKLEPGRAARRELRVRGAGLPGRNGAPSGTLVVHLTPSLPAAADPALVPLLEAIEAQLADASNRQLPDVASWEARWLAAPPTPH